MPQTFDAVQTGSILALSRGPSNGLTLDVGIGGTVTAGAFGDEFIVFTGVSTVDALGVTANLFAYLDGGVTTTILGSNQYDVLYVRPETMMPGDPGLLFDGRGGDDFLSSGWGNDTLRGGDGDDHAYGYGGNDKLGGGNGNDLLKGDTGADSLYGDQGNDTLYGDEGRDLLNGGAGNDLIYDGAGADRIDGGNGRDRVVLDGNQADYVITRTGATSWSLRDIATGDVDRVTDAEVLDFADSALGLTALTAYVENGIFRVAGMAEDGARDYVTISANDETRRAQVRGTDGEVIGTYKLLADGYRVQQIDFGAVSGADVHFTWRITSDGGYRSLNASAGDDTVTLTGLGPRFTGTYVTLGLGDDRIVATFSEDEIEAGAGNDFINAGTGEDTIYGGAGNDSIVGDSWRGDIAGNKEVYGDDGDADTLIFVNGVDGFTFGDNGDGSWTISEALTGQEIYVEGIELIAIGNNGPVSFADYVGAVA